MIPQSLSFRGSEARLVEEHFESASVAAQKERRFKSHRFIAPYTATGPVWNLNDFN